MAPRLVNVGELVCGMEDLVGRLVGDGVETTVRVGDGPLKARVDPAQLETVLMNVITNARDAMPDGGALTVEVGATEIDAELARGTGWRPSIA